MREAYRPYTKVLAMANGAPHTVDFTDTSGALLSCNYATVTSVSGGSSEQYFSVIPSGLFNLADAAADQPTASALSGATGLNGSGITGLVANSAGGSVVLAMAPRDYMTGLIISQSNDTFTIFAITYGLVNVVNAAADNTVNIGN